MAIKRTLELPEDHQKQLKIFKEEHNSLNFETAQELEEGIATRINQLQEKYEKEETIDPAEQQEYNLLMSKSDIIPQRDQLRIIALGNLLTESMRQSIKDFSTTLNQSLISDPKITQAAAKNVIKDLNNNNKEEEEEEETTSPARKRMKR